MICSSEAKGDEIRGQNSPVMVLLDCHEILK